MDTKNLSRKNVYKYGVLQWHSGFVLGIGVGILSTIIIQAILSQILMKA